MKLHVKPEGLHTAVSISGTIDEHADFAPLAKLGGKVRIDLRHVKRFNSYGCRKWVDEMRGFAKRAQITFVACSPAVVHQLNTTYGFLGSAAVESFIGVMACEHCDAHFEHVFEARQCGELHGLPEVACTKCGRPAELDDIADQYILFLSEPTNVGEPRK